MLLCYSPASRARAVGSPGCPGARVIGDCAIARDQCPLIQGALFKTHDQLRISVRHCFRCLSFNSIQRAFSKTHDFSLDGPFGLRWEPLIQGAFSKTHDESEFDGHIRRAMPLIQGAFSKTHDPV